MSSEPSSADDPGPPRRRGARRPGRDRVFVVPAWAPWGAIVALAAAMAGAFALGFRLGRDAETPSVPRRPTANSPRLAQTAPAAAPRPDAGPEAAVPAGTVATASTSTAAAEAASPGRVDEDAMGAAPSPQPEAEGPTDGRWGVQVGAFPTRAEARARRRDLAWTDLPRYVVPVDLPGRGTWFRVRVGNFVDRDDAEAAARRIRRRSGRRPLVVRYP